MPDITTYQHLVKTKPFNHQIQAVNFMIEQGPEWALLMEMGTGKTLSLIIWALYLWTQKRIDSLIILCPKPLVGNECAEFIRHTADGLPIFLCPFSGGVNKKIKTLNDFLAVKAIGESLPILVVNYDSLISDQIFQALLSVTTKLGTKMAVICDESTKIKTHSAKRSKKAIAIAAEAAFRGIMTGSPVTESPVDAFGQFRFLSPKIFGSSFFSFRAKYAVMGGYGNHQVVAFKNMPEFKQKMLKHSFRVTKKECLDLPDKVFEVRKFEMPVEMDDVYTQMANDFIAELGEDIFEAPIVLTKLMRLKEITSGYIKEGELVRDLAENPKIDMIEDIIEESQDQKIIIWCRERHEIDLIEKHLEKKIKVFSLHGGVKDKQTLVEDFKHCSGRAVLAGQVHTGGMGYTITQATLVIYFSNDFSREIRAQSEDRCHRAGQTNKVTYIDLVAKGTVDEYTMKILAGKAKMAASLTDVKEAIYFGNKSQPEFKELEF